MSHVIITCPSCEHAGRVRKRCAGRWVSCRKCCHAFRMPRLKDPVMQFLRMTVRTPIGMHAGPYVDLRRLILLRDKGAITVPEFERLVREWVMRHRFD